MDLFVIEDQKDSRAGEPYAYKYPLGWAIIGPIDKTPTEGAFTVNLQIVTNEELIKSFSKMWLTDFPHVAATNKTAMSVDDRIATRIVEDSIKKENGRYMLKMPFKTDSNKIPNKKIVAEKRLKYLKNKLLRQPHLQEGYIKTVQGYIEAGYARKLTDQELKEERRLGTWYIPHHAVTNPKKPGKMSCFRLRRSVFRKEPK